MRFENGILIIVVGGLISITNAMLILAFYDTKDPVQSRVELFCSYKENVGTNLCKLMRMWNGPCHHAKDMPICVEKQCKNKEMSTMPICKKYENLRVKRIKSVSSASMPLVLQFFDVKMHEKMSSLMRD